jgi:hypothetical protein
MEFKKFMRIISSIFLVVLIFSNSISKPKYSFGLYCGGGISKNIITSNIGKPNYFAVPAISVGLNAEAKISKNWGFKIDPNYLKLGYSYNITFTDLNGKVLSKDKLNVSLNYFQIPLLVKYSFGKKVKYFINAGPYFGYLYKYSYTTENVFQTFMNSNSKLNSIDYGLTSGIGLTFNSEKKLGFNVELRNNLGFMNLSDVYNVYDAKNKNFSFLLNFGIKYNFGVTSEK